MKAFKVVVLVIACIIVAPMLLALCFPAPVLSGEVLKVATTTFPSKLNPYAGNAASETFISSLMYEPVFGWNTETKWYDNTGLGDIDSLEIGKDGTAGFEEVKRSIGGGTEVTAYKMTFKIKDTALWSDGTKVTAQDIDYTYDYIQEISGGAFPIQRNFIQQGVVPGGKIDRATGEFSAYGYEVDPQNPQKMILYVNLPSSDLVRTLFTSLMVIPKVAWSRDIETAISKGGTHANFPNLAPVGSGPYKLARFSAGQNALFERNEGYESRKENFGPNSVFVKYIGEMGNAITEVGDGTYDALLDAVPASNADNFRTNKDNGSYGPKMGLYRSSAPSVSTMLINTRRHSDPRFRQAISLVIDQNALITNQLYGYGSQAGPSVTMDPEIVGDGTAGNEVAVNPFVPSLKVNEPVPQNIEKAKELIAPVMAAKGYTLGSDGFYKDSSNKNFEFNIYTKIENSSTMSLKEMLATMLKKIGIAVVQKNMPPNSSDGALKPGGSEDNAGWDSYIWGANIGADNYTVTYAYQFLMSDKLNAKGEVVGRALPSSTFNYGSFDGNDYTTENVSSWYGNDPLSSEYLKISELNNKINKFVTLPTATEKVANAKAIQQLLCGTYYKIPLYSADFLYFYNEARFEGFTQVNFESMFNAKTFKNLQYIGDKAV